jgi:hypothetical protein
MPGVGFGEGSAGRLAARGRGGPVKVRRVSISNFRGVRSGSVLLDSRSLLVGGNAVGKSTICEALDLALGLERLYWRPVIDEYVPRGAVPGRRGGSGAAARDPD